MGKHHRILSINGGGIRGLVPIKILHRIMKIAEEEGKSIDDLFDFIIGTSAGGIIAAGLTAPNPEGEGAKYTTQDLIDLFTKEATSIFPSKEENMWSKANEMVYPKYSRESLDNLLLEKFGNATLRDTTIPVALVSYSLDIDGPRIWSTLEIPRHNTYSELYLRDAAGATSAAPTYFGVKKTVTDTGELHDIDGGIFANSPTHLGVAVYKMSQAALNQGITIVSIGTGRFEDKPVAVEEREDTSTFSISYAATVTAVAGCGLAAYQFSSWVSAPACFLGGIIGAAIDGYNTISNVWNVARVNDGQIGVMSRGLIDQMMKGTEISDAIISHSIMDAIRINPEFDYKFYPMDKTGEAHLKHFSMAIDRKINDLDQSEQNSQLRRVVECLLSDSSLSEECQDAKQGPLDNEFLRMSELDLVGYFADPAVGQE